MDVSLNNNSPVSATSQQTPGSEFIGKPAIEGGWAVLQQAVDATSSGIIISDPHQPDCPIVYYNAAFERLTGYTGGEVIGRNCRFLQGPDTDRQTVASLGEAVRSATDCQVVIRNYRKDGTAFWNELYISPVYDDKSGRLTHFIGVQNDVTARIEAEAERDALLLQQQRVADTLQDALQSPQSPDVFPELTVAALYEAAWEEARIGGDFYDVFALDAGHAAFVLGDVTGKGLIAATYTRQVKVALRVFLREEADPARALGRLNQFIIDAQRLDGQSRYALISLVIAVVNLQTGAVQAASAGAEPPLLLPLAGGEAHALPSEGMLLGVEPGPEYGNVCATLAPGDRLLLMTDGITEARRRRGPLFEVERALQAAALASNQSLAPAETLQAIRDAAHAHAGGKLSDDVCLLLIERNR